MWTALKNWYFPTFLPFENPDHPLYSEAPSDEYEYECDGEIEINTAIGPNYSQHFYKPAEYEKWGDKWYKKS